MWFRTGSYRIPIALEFLKWWQCNLSANHPFHFTFYANSCGPIFRPEDKSHGQEPILVALFNLAQHLDIDGKIMRLIHAESPPLSFPNLETLRIRYDINSFLFDSHLFSLRPEHPILKLHMQSFRLDDVFKGPIVSSTSLMHLIFEDVYLSGCEWFDLIRACVNLQFGYFGLKILTHANSEDPRLANPPHFTHRHLRELVIRWQGDCYYPGNLGQYLLKNLFLPSLTAFRLSARLTIQDLHCIFNLMPPFTTSYWVAGNSIWFRPCDDEHFLQIHSRHVTPSSRDPNRNPPIHCQDVTPRHPNHSTNFICVYKRADDRIYQQSLFVKLFATGRADK